MLSEPQKKVNERSKKGGLHDRGRILNIQLIYYLNLKRIIRFFFFKRF
jgi:hypothetical protein